MSINIQLDGKLQKISGQTMTKEKIVEKLGYTPANETAVNTTITNLESTIDADIAAVNADLSELKTALENYIKDHPDIVEDGSGEVVFTDEAGNIIAKLDADGLHTTNIEADSFISGDDSLIINDPDGNKIFQVDKNGVETTKLKLASGDVDDQLASLSAEIAAVDAKITEVDYPVTSVNGKTGDVELEYSDINNAPAIEAEENEKSLIITDNSGNIILKAGNLDESDDKLTGIETTEVILKGGKVDERINSLNADLAAHTSKQTSNTDTDLVHITPAERALWNTKVDANYVDKKVADLVNSAPEELSTLDALAAALGDDENFAATVTEQLSQKAIQADFVAHRDDKVAHITATERAAWNNKSDVKSYYDLPDAPAITAGEDDSLLITDETGNIVFKVGELDEDTTGVETTTIKAKEANIENVYDKVTIDAKLAALEGAKADKDHEHKISGTVTKEIGGIKKDTAYNEASIMDVLSDLLFPYVAPVFNSISTSASSGTFEYGTTITISTVTPNFTKGSKDITSVKIGTTEGGEDLYSGTSATSGFDITLDPPKTFDGNTGGTIYCTISDGTTPVDKSASVSYKYYDYSKLTTSTTADTTGATKQLSSGADNTYSYSSGQYLWLYSRSSGKKIQTYVAGSWADVTTTATNAIELTLASGATAIYYAYRTDQFTATGSAKYRLA